MAGITPPPPPTPTVAPAPTLKPTTQQAQQEQARQDEQRRQAEEQAFQYNKEREARIAQEQGPRFDPTTGIYRTAQGAPLIVYGSSGQQYLVQQQQAQATQQQQAIQQAQALQQIAQQRAVASQAAQATAASQVQRAAAPGGRPDLLPVSEQMVLGERAARATGLPYVKGVTVGEVEAATTPISPEVARVAFLPQPKEGTYSPQMLTSRGVLYVTPIGAWELIQRGQIVASGSAGSYQAIMEQPWRYARDVQAMGLVPMTAETARSLAEAGAVPSTITRAGAVYSVPGGGYQVVSGRQIVGGGGVGAESITSPMLAAPYIAGIRPTTNVSPEVQQIREAGGIPVSSGLYLTRIGFPLGTDEQGRQISLQAWGRPTAPLAGTPLAPVGEAYLSATQAYESFQRERVVPFSTRWLPAAPGYEERFRLWGTAAMAVGPTAPIFWGMKASEAAGAPTKSELFGIGIPRATETAAEYPGQIYRGVREEPLTMGIMYGVGLGAAAISGIAPAITAAVPRLAAAGTWGARGLAGLYVLSSGVRIGTAPEPSREAAAITAKELTPLVAGAATPAFIEWLTSRTPSIQTWEALSAQEKKPIQRGQQQEIIQTIDVRPVIDLTQAKIVDTSPITMPEIIASKPPMLSQETISSLIQARSIAAVPAVAPVAEVAAPMADLNYPFVLVGGATRIGQTAWLDTGQFSTELLTPAAAAAMAGLSRVDPIIAATSQVRREERRDMTTTTRGFVSAAELSGLTVQVGTVTTEVPVQQEDQIVGPLAMTEAAVTPTTVLTTVTVPVTVPVVFPTVEVPPVTTTTTPPPGLPVWPAFPQGGGVGSGILRGRREWYELLPLELPDLGMGYIGGKKGRRGYVSPEDRPEIRREKQLRARNVRMKRGAIDADLVDGKGKKVAHLHDKVVVRKNTYVGNWNRRERKVYVDPRLRPKEREAVALHEAVERHEAVSRHLPKYPAHLVAEHLEGQWDRSHGLGKGYSHHVEALFRSNLEKAGHPIGLGGKVFTSDNAVAKMMGGITRRKRKR